MLTKQEIANTVQCLVLNDDYNPILETVIDDHVQKFAFEMIRHIARARIQGVDTNSNWIEEEFFSVSESTDELNSPTSNDIEITHFLNPVVDIVDTYRQQSSVSLQNIASAIGNVDLKLTVNCDSIGLIMDIGEGLDFLSILAVKIPQIRGGAWSTAGKQVEIPLMKTLCKLFSVPDEHYSEKGLTTEGREVDFHLINPDGDMLFCEVKLMGRGNPESADAVIARDTDIFVADKLSDLNKEQLPQRKTHWVELRSENGYKRFFDILQELNIPCSDFDGKADERLDEIFETVFK